MYSRSFQSQEQTKFYLCQRTFINRARASYALDLFGLLLLQHVIDHSAEYLRYNVAIDEQLHSALLTKGLSAAEDWQKREVS